MAESRETGMLYRLIYNSFNVPSSNWELLQPSETFLPVDDPGKASTTAFTMVGRSPTVRGCSSRLFLLPSSADFEGRFLETIFLGGFFFVTVFLAFTSSTRTAHSPSDNDKQSLDAMCCWFYENATTYLSQYHN